MKKIFDLDYLQNAEFTEEDLKQLFDNNAFNLSLIVGMFKMTNQKLSEHDIIRLVKTDKYWMYKYFWTKSERETFEICLINAYKNLYRYSEERTKSLVDFWIIQYGLTNCNQKKKKQLRLDD